MAHGPQNGLSRTHAIAAETARSPRVCGGCTLVGTGAARTARTRDDLINGDPASCPRVILVYARGSTEDGNLGSLGPLLATRLEAQFQDQGGVWIQGVGSPYAATLLDNALPRGTSDAAIREMTRMFKLADSKCPNAKIISGGYSQGAALTAASISVGLDSTPRVRNKIVGVVLFGYTKNKQNRGAIPRYPAEGTRIFCAPGDLVCEGTLIVTEAHHGYAPYAQGEGADFLISKVN
ncbi:Cutinase, A lipolytic enzyme with A preformed Oxyanion hole [Microdochium trichocladiopsis]|uniref:Cutinase n=1 Tax=Microdochium trichocladiopsis TaxID=1682393 RepID=A0A9P9BJ25_9PEZI|nr:Cutinase, A lipolytic enzyme with A preformed Oxyanion hole [Microdochium trichocladiopsis]KAH7014206.1 Cutinase, A lipolytic enzyme with A preformed Oxyanion hole [Microdochium trichocladiopsis]